MTRVWPFLMEWRPCMELARDSFLVLTPNLRAMLQMVSPFLTLYLLRRAALLCPEECLRDASLSRLERRVRAVLSCLERLDPALAVLVRPAESFSLRPAFIILCLPRRLSRASFATVVWCLLAMDARVSPLFTR